MELIHAVAFMQDLNLLDYMRRAAPGEFFGEDVMAITAQVRTAPGSKKCGVTVTAQGCRKIRLVRIEVKIDKVPSREGELIEVVDKILLFGKVQGVTVSPA